MEQNTLERKFVSEDGYEICVLCKDKTEYKVETGVDFRQGFTGGGGQTCPKCTLILKEYRDMEYNQGNQGN